MKIEMCSTDFKASQDGGSGFSLVHFNLYVDTENVQHIDIKKQQLLLSCKIGLYPILLKSSNSTKKLHYHCHTSAGYHNCCTDHVFLQSDTKYRYILDGIEYYRQLYSQLSKMFLSEQQLSVCLKMTNTCSICPAIVISDLGTLFLDSWSSKVAITPLLSLWSQNGFLPVNKPNKFKNLKYTSIRSV